MPSHRHPPTTGPRRGDPRWLAAPLLVAVAAAGALSGKAIGSVSMLRPSDDRLAVASPGPAPFASDRSAQEQLPDHYPLVTPTGTVPVVALSLHGRLRRTSERWSDVPDRVPLEAEDEWELSEAEIDHLAQWQPARTAPPKPAPERAGIPASAPAGAIPKTPSRAPRGTATGASAKAQTNTVAIAAEAATPPTAPAPGL